MSRRVREPVGHPGSEVIYARAAGLLPGGVNSPVRAMRSIGREHPIFIERGEGFELIDVDGHRYVDWVCSWGPLILGHAHPARRRGGSRRRRAGHQLRRADRGRGRARRRGRDRVASVEMVRMVSSGTEATMSAIRLARAATGRDRVAQVRRRLPRPRRRPARRGRLRPGDQRDPGQPGRHGGTGRRDDRSSPGTTREALERALAEHEFAAILAEPIPANMGVVEPPSRVPRARCASGADANGALLVLDEVITGFRVARGGAQELLGVEADLTVMGKVIGGGLPAAAYGGRAS